MTDTIVWDYTRKHCGTVTDESVANGLTEKDFTPATKAHIQPSYKPIEFTPHGQRFADVIRQELAKDDTLSQITAEMKAWCYLAKTSPKSVKLELNRCGHIFVRPKGNSVSMITTLADVSYWYKRS